MLLYERFDVIATASLPVTASPLIANLETDLDRSDPLGGIGNFCGLPAVSVPCGLDSKKLPVGIQFVGRALDEHKVIAAARLFNNKPTGIASARHLRSIPNIIAVMSVIESQ